MDGTHPLKTAAEAVRRRLEANHYAAEGSCFEAAVACGIILAADLDLNIRLVKGLVRDIDHWWLRVDGIIADPTSHQFDPPPNPQEYVFQHYHGIDFHELRCLLGDCL